MKGIILSGTLTGKYFDGEVLFSAFLNPGSYAKTLSIEGHVGEAVRMLGTDFYPCGDVYIRDIYRDSLTKR